MVLIQGAKDLVVKPGQLVSAKEQDQLAEAQQADDTLFGKDHIGSILQKTLFTKSPSVRMIMPKKLGVHGMALLRPESVAKASLYALNRAHRRLSSADATNQ